MNSSMVEASSHTRAEMDTKETAATHLGSHLRLWIPAAALLAADLWTKSWIFANQGPEEIKTVVPGWLVFRRSLNAGALFGMGQGMSTLFVAASVVALIFVLYIFAYSLRSHRSLHIALGLILAGAIGNLYDRIYVQADVVQLRANDYEPIGLILDQDDRTLSLGSYPDREPMHTIRIGDIEGVRRQGVVRDFIKFEGRLFGHELWPWVFNIADSSLVCGVSLLILNFWFERRRMRTTTGEAAAHSEAR